MAGRSSGSRQSSRGSQSTHRGSTRNYPRVARINEVMREILAEELERIDDDRLGLLTITGVTVDSDLRHATVWLSALLHEGRVEAMLAAVNEHRAPLQTAVARQVRMKRTPMLQFAADPAITNGQRIEDVIRALPPRREHPEDELDELDESGD
jgi:ribosome-binding factor A